MGSNHLRLAEEGIKQVLGIRWKTLKNKKQDLTPWIRSERV